MSATSIITSHVSSVLETPISSAQTGIFDEVSIPTKDCTLFCRTVGKGKPLVVINGGPGFTHDYLLELAKLAANYKVIFYDPRGCGLSPCKIDEENMQMGRYVEDLDILRQALDLDTISMIGHSWGGLVAMRYAIEHEKCVDKLILLNSLSAVQKYNSSEANPYMDGIRKIQKSEAFRKEDALGIAEGYRDLFRSFCFDPKKADALNFTMTEQAAVNSIAIREAFETNFFSKSYDYQAELKKLNTKALIVYGENDRLPVSIATNLHSNLGNSRPVSIKDCGHFPHVEQPEVLINELSSFLDEKNH